MSDKIDELSLPSAVIARILKDAVPDGINISKEAKATVGRAASIFVLYATACASQVQAASQRKTLAVNDVYTALEDMMLEDMIDLVKESVEAVHSDKSKKEAPSPTKSASSKVKRKRSESTKETEPVNSESVIESAVDELEFTME